VGGGGGDLLSGHALLGVVIGLASAYAIRSLNTCAVINLAKSYQTQAVKTGKYHVVQNQQSLDANEIVYEKYMISVSYTLFNWIIVLPIHIYFRSQ
jgi:hypothetical protein